MLKTPRLALFFITSEVPYANVTHCFKPKLFDFQSGKWSSIFEKKKKLGTSSGIKKALLS